MPKPSRTEIILKVLKLLLEERIFTADTIRTEPTVEEVTLYKQLKDAIQEEEQEFGSKQLQS